MGVNDGGVKRGDREDTGDLEAQPKDGVSRGGSGVPGGGGGAEGAPTVSNDAFAGTPTRSSPAVPDPADPQVSPEGDEEE